MIGLPDDERLVVNRAVTFPPPGFIGEFRCQGDHHLTCETCGAYVEVRYHQLHSDWHADV